MGEETGHWDSENWMVVSDHKGKEKTKIVP